MNAPKLAYSLFLPFTIWLVYGSPDLRLMGNLVLFLVVVLHLFAVIWLRWIFAIFQGDAFTYGMVALGINISSMLSTFAAAFITFYIYDHRIQTVSMISPFAWGVICLGFLVTIAVPLLTTRHVAPLAKESSRRQYEDPSSGSNRS